MCLLFLSIERAEAWHVDVDEKARASILHESNDDEQNFMHNRSCHHAMMHTARGRAGQLWLTAAGKRSCATDASARHRRRNFMQFNAPFHANVGLYARAV